MRLCFGILYFLFTVTLANAAGNKLPLIVILDPGHGGEDTGTIQSSQGYHLIEKDFTLALAEQTLRALRQFNIPAVLTRTNDKTTSLDDRIAFANAQSLRAEATIFISIHANSSPNHESSGVETYVFNATSNRASHRLAEIENGRKMGEHDIVDLIMADLTTTANYGDSIKLACAIHKAVNSGTRVYYPLSKDRGVKQAHFYVLMKGLMPGILFEPGFASNSEEMKRLLSPHYQGLLARELTQGILKYWNLRQNTATGNVLLASSAERAPAIFSGVKKRGPLNNTDNIKCD